MDWKLENPPALQPSEKVAIDFEYANGPDPRLSRPFAVSVWSPARNRGWYLPWGHEGGGNLDEAVVKRWYRTELKDRDVWGLNIKAEMHCTYQWGLDPERIGMRPHDVGYMSALLNENRITRAGYEGFSLKALAIRHLADNERKVEPEVAPEDFGKVHASLIAERGISDAYLTWRLREVLQPQIQREELQTVLDLEDRCIYAVVGMERTGARIDRPKLEQWMEQVPLEVERLRDKIESESGIKVNPNGRKSLTAVFEKLGLKVPLVIDKEKEEERPTFDAAHLKALKHPVIQDVIAMRKLASIQSKYLKKYLSALDGDNLIHYHLHQLATTEEAGDYYGTVTGRFSCGGGKYAINIQQVAKGSKQVEQFAECGLPPRFIIRELFIPAEGKKICASDAEQIEFRLFAHYSKDEDILNAYRKNPRIDFHLMATRIMNPNVRDEALLAKLRSNMKQNNFGVIYGMGRQTLAERLGLTCACDRNWRILGADGWPLYKFWDNDEHNGNCLARQANDIMNKYHAQFPAAKRLIKHASELAERRGYVKTILGRRRRYPEGRRLHSALNAVVQGTAADYFKTKLCEMWNARDDLGIDLRMPVHDEFVYDIADETQLPKVQELLDAQSFDRLRVPLLWATKMGNNWLFS
jgi:DNA polymerase-1